MYTAVIVDDEKWVIKSLRATLMGIGGVDVLGEARNGEAGLELIRQTQPDIAFIDISMPGMSGLALMQALEQESARPYVVIISGYAEFAYAQKAMLNGAIAYCLKPFSKGELADAVQRAGRLLSDSPASSGAPKAQPEPEARPDSGNESVDVMLAFIDRHFSEDVSIQMLADLLPINANYASQLFSRVMGEPFSSYLARKRLDEAMRLLRESRLSIAEIAAAVGYRDYFYFTKVFKKTAGCTPTQYKNRAAQPAKED